MWLLLLLLSAVNAINVISHHVAVDTMSMGSVRFKAATYIVRLDADLLLNGQPISDLPLTVIPAKRVPSITAEQCKSRCMPRCRRWCRRVCHAKHSKCRSRCRCKCKRRCRCGCKQRNGSTSATQARICRTRAKRQCRAAWHDDDEYDDGEEDRLMAEGHDEQEESDTEEQEQDGDDDESGDHDEDEISIEQEQEPTSNTPTSNTPTSIPSTIIMGPPPPAPPPSANGAVDPFPYAEQSHFLPPAISAMLGSATLVCACPTCPNDNAGCASGVCVYASAASAADLAREMAAGPPRSFVPLPALEEPAAELFAMFAGTFDAAAAIKAHNTFVAFKILRVYDANRQAWIDYVPQQLDPEQCRVRFTEGVFADDGFTTPLPLEYKPPCSLPAFNALSAQLSSAIDAIDVDARDSNVADFFAHRHGTPPVARQLTAAARCVDRLSQDD